jgi:RES domain-containing protein
VGNPRVRDAGFDSNALQKLVPKTLKGRWYRTVKNKYRTKVKSPEGSAKVEGRYHTTDVDMVIYLSDSPTLSMNESSKAFQTVPLKESAWYTATFTVELKRVLDLTDPEALSRLGVTPADLVQPKPGGYRVPQEIAKEARANAFEAILAPTARPGMSGKNLVVFLEVLADSGGTAALAK